MPSIDAAAELTVLCARPSTTAATDPTLRAVLDELGDERVHQVGPRPGPEIDALLTGRVLVIGDDADLAAVVTRLDRRELLAAVMVAYAPLTASPLAELWSLPTGAASVRLARYGDPDLVPLLRDEAGDVLVGEATIGPIRGTASVDGQRLVNGAARGLIVQPDREHGLTVTLVPRRFGMVGRRPTTRPGAELRIESAPATLVSDGRERDTPVEKWHWARHPLPLRLVRGVVE